MKNMSKATGVKSKENKIDYFEIVRKSPFQGKSFSISEIRKQILETRAEKLNEHRNEI